MPRVGFSGPAAAAGGALGPFPAAALLADASALPTTSRIGAVLEALRQGTSLTDLLRSGDVNNIASALGILDVLAVGRYDATFPILTSGRVSAFQLDINGRLVTFPYYEDAAGVMRVGSGFNTGADSQTASTGRIGAKGLMGFNGTSWDRLRGNTEGTLLASAARTATTSSADQTNHNARGVRVFLNVTVVPGVDSITLAIEEKDPISSNYLAVLTGTAIITTGQKPTFIVYPGVPTVANLDAGEPLPRTWRVTVTHSAASSFTYSAGFALIR